MSLQYELLLLAETQAGLHVNWPEIEMSRPLFLKLALHQDLLVALTLLWRYELTAAFIGAPWEYNGVWSDSTGIQILRDLAGF